MASCYIIDIDGTLADQSQRAHHLKKQPKDWDSFFAEAINDKPFKHMQTLLGDLNDIGVNFIYVSGRPEKYKRQTFDWLDMHHFPMGRWLYMRKNGDFRADDIIKLDILQQLRAEGWEPILALDDRNRVVKMWRDNGIPCLQVAEGDF